MWPLQTLHGLLQVINNDSPLWLVQVQNGEWTSSECLHSVWVLEFFPLTILPSYFSRVCGMSLDVWAAYYSTKTQADPCIGYGALFLHSLFYSRILLHNFKPFQCPKFWSPQLTNTDGLCPVFTCFYHPRAHLICFPFLKDQSPVMVFVQPVKTISYILFSFLDGRGQV